jgi:hypothetical protein
MNLWTRWRYLLLCIVMIIVAFVTVGIFDIVISAIYSGFYSNAAFIITFGVGGIFASFISYGMAVEHAPVKNEFTRWSLIATIITLGVLFFFVLAPLEGGEYKTPFKAFGTTLALTALLFVKGKIGF